jgi:hypothetical protein
MSCAGLRDQLDALALLNDPQRRGRGLERLVGDLFRRHHFSATINPGIARPRQTDVLATRVSEHYLVECKWRSHKADADDIDSLRAGWTGPSPTSSASSSAGRGSPRR